jgi:hypothetical protein
VPNCTQAAFDFPPLKRRRIEANFEGGDITGDGGVLLLRQVDQRLGLSAAVARALDDPRRQASCMHDGVSLLRQRLYALALGYEDLNDHQSLRADVALQTAVDRDTVLASSATLCRWENRADREAVWKLHEVLVDQFMASFKRVPKKLVLDFDATDDVVHGKQDGRFFHGYYDDYCSLLVKRFRQVWPKVRIIFRGDSGFCRWRMLAWCERHGIGYIVGIAQNKRLNACTAQLQRDAEDCFAELGSTVRWFTEIRYAARTWDHPRRVIAKIEHTDKGSNPRYVVTNLEGDAQALYEHVYCARGDMENRIKEQQLDLFADRTSCHRWWPNQFRLLLSSLAYTLLESIRRLALQGTELAHAYVGTLRLKLLKIGAVILRNTRRVRFLLSSAYPYQKLFFKVAATLAPG